MRARKQRPAPGGVLPANPSIRDFAAHLGMSKTEVHRCMDLASIPRDDFERLLSEILAESAATRRITSARQILTKWKPSPSGDRLGAQIATCPHCGGLLK